MRRLCPDGGPVPEHFLKMDRDVVERVCSEILERPADVSWDTIAGLRHAKAAVQELAVWPLMKPELFRGARAVPKGLLLFGPPGTGKTLIGRAVASQCGATFFSISASSLTSKWIGEGEKMVRALFAVAARCEPAIIFVDEIDSLLSARKSDGEHESSRRMKTEFLVQMDGLGNSEGPGGEEARLLLIGATNRPQELDDGARRRLAKQLYIPLPCAAARRAIVTNILGADASVKHALSDADLDKVVEKTEGYSGSDMKHLVQEAARAPLRELFKRSAARSDARGEDPRDGDARGAVPGADAPSPSAMRPIKLVDFKRASKQVRPSVTDADIRFHEEWNRKHGASSAADAEDDEGEEDDEW
jgi:SpoVK/Ycf46/Vps4 family AAA+-type ATPase